MAEVPAAEGEVLDRKECLDLLSEGGVGRVAINVAGWCPLVRPVNFIFDEPSQSVVFRSGRGSKLTAVLRAQQAAFEVDAIDREARTGSSVIVTGRAEEVTRASELARLEAAQPEVWAPGEHPFWVRIRIETISGRRVHPGAVTGPG